jgi:predicted dehydrogenase
MTQLQLKWGILGAGSIARTFTKGVKESQSGEVVAVGSRSQESADKFGDEFGIAIRHASYEALLSDPNVQAVYISTPHPLHAEWAIKAARAKKHILCEKPLTINGSEAMRVIEAARQNGVILMEAFMYRCHPQTSKLVEIIKAKTIGDVKLIRATFTFAAGFNPESRLFNKELGGGGILDVGCYTTSMARLVAGAALGKEFAEPYEVKAVGHLGESGVDDYATAVLKFDGGIIAQVATGVALNSDNFLQIYGSNGSITLYDPWFCGNAKIVVNANGKTEEIEVESSAGLYALEADAFAQAVESGKVQSPAMSPADTQGNMDTLDKWRKEIGLEYSNDTLQGQVGPLTNELLRTLPDAAMKYGEIKGLDKKVSRVVMGTMLEGSFNSSTTGMALYDDFFERGGNCFDTAYIYQGGWSETVLGHWIKSRGVRDDVVIIAKGVHPPQDNPDSIATQLDESLERMGLEHADIYMMHRDNEKYPVSEWVDALNEQVKKGPNQDFWRLELECSAGARSQ